MKSFKFQPVAWLTTIAVLLGGLLEADRQFHVLPGTLGHWAAFAAAAIAIILVGLKAHESATPVADPKAADGTPLVPVDTLPTVR